MCACLTPQARACLDEISKFLGEFEKMVNYIKAACEEANCDTSLKNLISMLREACTILFAKSVAKGLNMAQMPSENDSYVSSQHLKRALMHAKKGYEHLEACRP